MIEFVFSERYTVFIVGCILMLWWIHRDKLRKHELEHARHYREFTKREQELLNKIDELEKALEVHRGPYR